MTGITSVWYHARKKPPDLHSSLEKSFLCLRQDRSYSYFSGSVQPRDSQFWVAEHVGSFVWDALLADGKYPLLAPCESSGTCSCISRILRTSSLQFGHPPISSQKPGGYIFSFPPGWLSQAPNTLLRPHLGQEKLRQHEVFGWIALHEGVALVSSFYKATGVQACLSFPRHHLLYHRASLPEQT